MVLLLQSLDLGAKLARSILLSALLLKHHLAYGIITRLEVLLELLHLFGKSLDRLLVRSLIVGPLLLSES